MECKVMDKAIPVSHVLLDDFIECPVDYAFVLPDYLADMAAILKCTLIPTVQSRQFSGDRLQVDGTVTVQVLYLDEARKCVRSCEFAQPFDCHFTVKETGNHASVDLTTHVGYVNCRATGPRKLSLHGAFSVKCRITAERCVPVVGDVAQDGWCAKRCMVHYAVPTVCTEKMFTVSEVTEIGAGNPTIQTLVRACATPIITDCKFIQGKAIVKGELSVHTLYVADAELGLMQKTEHRLPFSQLIDVEGLTEDWHCECDVRALSCEVYTTANQNGENRLLDIHVRLCASVSCTKSGEEQAVCDAYATAYPLTTEYTDLTTERLYGIEQGRSTIRQTMDMPGDGMCDVVDVWGEIASVSDRCDNGCAVADGKMTVCLLARDENGTIAYYERPWEFSLSFDTPCGSQQTTLRVCRLDYTVTGAQIELCADLSVCRRVYEVERHRVMTSVAADESSAFAPDTAAIKIYYAAAGESVWDIAKQYHTSVDAVTAENGLSGDRLDDDTMLLIPMC